MRDLLEFETAPDSTEAFERIAGLSREEVDALPYGLMIFDHAGVVRLYNAYESRLSRRRAADVIGRNWFRDVAPCTRVGAFEGRFRAFVARADLSEVVKFEFRFHFLHGAQDVQVTFAHTLDERVMVIVTRRPLGEGGRALDVTEPLTANTDDGRARGGLGGAIAPPRAFFVAAFDGDREALVRGAARWGAAILQGLEAYSDRVHQRPLVGLPTLLATAILDEAFAAQGLGRIELDFGAGARGVLGFAVRAVDLPNELAEALYESILREIATGLCGRSLDVVCIGRHGEILRFAATPASKAAVLRRWKAGAMPIAELARRAGLEVWS